LQDKKTAIPTTGRPGDGQDRECDFAHVQETGFTDRGVMMAHRAEPPLPQPLPPWLWRSCCSLCNAHRPLPSRAVPTDRTSRARRARQRPCRPCLRPRSASPSGYSSCCCGHHVIAKQSSAGWGGCFWGKRRNSPFVRAQWPSGCRLRILPCFTGTHRFPSMTRDQGSATPFKRNQIVRRSGSS